MKVASESIASDEHRGALAGRLLKQLKRLEGQERADAVARLGELSPGLPSDLMMTDEQVRALAAAGMDIGAHTVNHPILSLLDDEACRWEIDESARYLETLTGVRPRHFAYPNGNYTQALMDLLDRMGFASATILEDRLVHAGAPVQALPRIGVGRYDPLARLKLRLVGI